LLAQEATTSTSLVQRLTAESLMRLGLLKEKIAA
jgi:hypothetical protein